MYMTYPQNVYASAPRDIRDAWRHGFEHGVTLGCRADHVEDFYRSDYKLQLAYISGVQDGEEACFPTSGELAGCVSALVLYELYCEFPHVIAMLNRRER